jgi:hypothetical protein
MNMLSYQDVNGVALEREFVTSNGVALDKLKTIADAVAVNAASKIPHKNVS